MEAKERDYDDPLKPSKPTIGFFVPVTNLEATISQNVTESEESPGLRIDFYCCVSFQCQRTLNFMCVNEKVAMYERPRVNEKVERGSTFTFTSDLPYIYIAFVLSTRAKIYVRTHVKITR